MTEAPYLQTITDEQLEAMIERRRRIYLTHLRNDDAEIAESLKFHLNRALAEAKRREMV